MVASPQAERPLRVLAWPGLGARAKNPYTWLLYTHLAALGVRVDDFTPRRALTGRYDVLHMHWPDKALNARWLAGRMAGAAAALGMLDVAKARGARVVWTAHNARPHESRHRRLETWFWDAVLRRVDAVVHPSLAGQTATEAAYPDVRALPHGVVPLGHFRGTYPATVTRAAARASFGRAESTRVVTFLGLIRPYKNVPHLVRTVRQLPGDPGRYALLVAGEPLDRAIAEEVRSAADADPRVQMTLEHVPDIDVQRYLRAADLVVLPFRDITNSASALLALSFDRPVLVPALGAMGELQAIVGPEWVRTYQGELTADTLERALEWAADRSDGSAPLDALGWPEIARRTLAVYRQAGA